VVYTATDMRPYIPRPIIIPIVVDEKAQAEGQIASQDMRRYRPRPIIIPGPCDSVKTTVDLAAIDMRPYIPKPIIIPVPVDEKAQA